MLAAVRTWNLILKRGPAAHTYISCQVECICQPHRAADGRIVACLLDLCDRTPVKLQTKDFDFQMRARAWNSSNVASLVCRLAPSPRSGTYLQETKFLSCNFWKCTTWQVSVVLSPIVPSFLSLALHCFIQPFLSKATFLLNVDVWTVHPRPTSSRR
jgi:hypothetical protein